MKVFEMFGFGNKKKYEKFAQILSDLGDISPTKANDYVAANKGEIQSAFNRGLGPFEAVAYISENQMERIHAAHMLNDLELAKDIDDFWLLVALNCIVFWKSQGASSADLDINFKYWKIVTEMPVSPPDEGFTYGDKLQRLVDDMKAKGD